MPQPIEKLLTATEYPQPAQRVQTVQRGSVVSFSYIGQTKRPIHDTYPLVIVADIFSDRIRGVNLHYLTLPYIKFLIANFANNSFSYRIFKNNSFMVDGFRSYKRVGIGQMRMLDLGFLKNLLNIVRSLDITEIEQMRQQITQMLLQQQEQMQAVPGVEYGRIQR